MVVSRTYGVCFTALLFQGFITSPHHSYPRANPERPSNGNQIAPPEQTKIYLFAMGRSGDISRLNDDAVIGQYDLIVERVNA